MIKRGWNFSESVFPVAGARTYRYSQLSIESSKWPWSRTMTTPRLHIYLIFLLFLSLGEFAKTILLEKSQFPDTITIHYTQYNNKPFVHVSIVSGFNSFHNSLSIGRIYFTGFISFRHCRMIFIPSSASFFDRFNGGRKRIVRSLHPISISPFSSAFSLRSSRF